MDTANNTVSDDVRNLETEIYNLKHQRDNLFDRKLELVCKKYDECYGEYPESKLEGKAIYDYYCEELKGEQCC